jgi:uncharacterized protein YdaU (DUF1376 family)
MRFYWGDYFKDTRRLNRLEHSAYLLLLGEMWIQGGKLPNDDVELAAFAMCSMEEWAEVRPAVMRFFKPSRGKLTQKRLAAEMEKYSVTVRKRKAAGKAGSDVTNRKRKETSAANAEHMPTKPEPEPEPERKKIENAPAAPIAPPRKRSKTAASDLAKTIWAMQPILNGKRRQTLPDVHAALDAAVARGGDPVQIEAACRVFYRLPDSTKEGGQFAMGASRLIERDRWREFAPSAGGGSADRVAGWDADVWGKAVEAYRHAGSWSEGMGPPPDKAGCRAPASVLREHGYLGAPPLPFERPAA